MLTTMQVRVIVTCLFAVVLSVCSGCASAARTPSPAVDSLDRIVKAGTINVCSTGDYRPFTYRDAQNTWSGLDIDMATDLAHRLNVKLNLVPTTWTSLMSDLGTKCDLAMGGITLTLPRAQRALFTAPYLRDGKAAIVRCAESGRFSNLGDIDQPGVRVITPPGGSNADFDKSQLHRARIIDFPDNNSIFGQLTKNGADVMITDTSEVRWEVKQNPALCPVSVDHPFTFEQKAYLIARSDTDVQQWVDDWLNISQNDGTYASLSQKYLGQVVGP